jgi:hypothetical protein
MLVIIVHLFLSSVSVLRPLNLSRYIFLISVSLNDVGKNVWRVHPTQYQRLTLLLGFYEGSTGIRYKNLCSDHEFRDNQCSESHTLLGGIMKLIP